MKKFLVALSLVLSMVTTAGAGVKVTTTPLGDKPVRPAKRVVSTADFLVRENFDCVTENDTEFAKPLADYYNKYIMDPALTHGDQWTSDRAYAADGTIALCTPDPQGPAWIATPQADYSGSVTVSFIAKYARYEFEDQDGRRLHWAGSSVRMALMSDEEEPCDVKSDGKKEEPYLLCDVRLYENQGWTRITVEFDNYSAYNDARLQFYTGNSIYIDEIEVSTSADKFIAAPVVKGIRDVTETSFTVDFQPVRKAYNYYTYLYTLEGYDDEGNPKYSPILDAETMKDIEEYGMTIDEWFDGLPDAYRNFGKVEGDEPTSFTYTDLDPDKDYYFAVRSHYVLSFSDSKILPAKYIAAPILDEATEMKDNSFCANWFPIAKADSYEVTLYGVDEAKEDETDFIIFEEDFNNVSQYTDAEDIYAPEAMDVNKGITLDDLTTTRGWDTELGATLLVKGKLGLNYFNYWLTSPEIYVGNADQVRLAMRCEVPTPNSTFYIRFAGLQYSVEAEGNLFESEVLLPTNGLETTNFEITGPEYDSVFIDYVVISQDLKAGDRVYTYLDKAETTSTSHTFTDLDTERYSLFGYSVKALQGEGYSALRSGISDRMLVDLPNGKSHSNIDSATAEDVYEVERFGIDGVKLSGKTKGLNIVRMSDGSVRKIFY